MVGVLLVAGVALLLTSVKGQAAPSASESTRPDTVPSAVKTRPGFRDMIPPTTRRAIGPGRVGDSRYDAKGGTEALALVKKDGLRTADAAPPRKSSASVRPGRPVAVLQPVRQKTLPPSRFRVPTTPSLKGR